MILDRIENHCRYPLGSAWNQAFDFLKTLSPETPEGRYDLLDEDRMFAMVMSYEPLQKEKGRPEAHNTYVDIQSTLSSIEGMYIYDRKELEIQSSYDSMKDVEFFAQNEAHEHFICVAPGEFAVFFATDAHMPQMRVPGINDLIKKVVVKVHKDLLTPNL